MWHATDLVVIASGALGNRERLLANEQAVRGVESLEEGEIQGILQAAFLTSGFGVLREVPYPAQWRSKRGRRKSLPEQSERQRCDLVLTPRPGQRLSDALAVERERSALIEQAAGTLFQERPLEPEPSGVAPDDQVGPGDVYWLECKVVGQFRYAAGVPGPNSTYASELIRGIGGDLRKLRDDPGIVSGGVLLVLFTESAAVAEADLGIAMHRLMDRGMVFRAPVMSGIAIPERIGNHHCLCAIIEPMR